MDQQVSSNEQINVKAAKFRTLAAKRVNKAMRSIQRIGNLSRRSSYDYTADEIDKMFRAMRDELDAAEKRFKPQQTTFRWD
jgi:hypothetical protein